MNAIVVFIHCDIQNPMEFILDGPMPANNVQNTLCIARQSGDVIPDRLCLFFSNNSCADNHCDTFQTSPISRIADDFQVFWIGCAPTFANIYPAMTTVGRFCIMERSILKILSLVNGKKICDVFKQVALVLFDAQGITSLSIHNRLGDFGLCTHRINSYNTTRNRKHF